MPGLVRAVLLAATIAALIAAWFERPKPVEHNPATYCAQPVWDRYGNQVGGKWVMCSELDRYEWA